jgi:hypothetical protein
MAISWKRNYHISGTYCETSGWIPTSQDAFRSYLAQVVRLEWQRWITIEPSLAQSLIQTGFSSDAIEEFMRVDTTNYPRTSLRGDSGVAAVTFCQSKHGFYIL